MRILLLVLSLALVPILAQTASAQAPNRPPQGIDLATAKMMAAAAEAEAVKLDASVAIAILDANGDLVYLQRMDGVSPRGVTSSQGKARAAVLFGLPTRQVRDAADAGEPLATRLIVPAAGAWELTIQQGAFPILKDGKVVAGIGVGGARVDEQVAQAGMDALP